MVVVYITLTALRLIRVSIPVIAAVAIYSFHVWFQYIQITVEQKYITHGTANRLARIARVFSILNKFIEKSKYG